MKTLTAKEKKRSNQQFPVNLSWFQVFDGSKGNWGHIEKAYEAAKISGYDYFTWNDRVYMTDDKGSQTYIYKKKDGSFQYDLNLLAEHWIGEKVVKVSGKPFKSGSHEATVKGVLGHNPHSKDPGYDKPAFIFEEDESVVECLKCELKNNNYEDR